MCKCVLNWIDAVVTSVWVSDGKIPHFKVIDAWPESLVWYVAAAFNCVALMTCRYIFPFFLSSHRYAMIRSTIRWQCAHNNLTHPLAHPHQFISNWKLTTVSTVRIQCGLDRKRLHFTFKSKHCAASFIVCTLHIHLDKHLKEEREKKKLCQQSKCGHMFKI